MGFLSLIAGIFKPVLQLIDDLHLSKEEKERFKIQMTALKLEYEKKALHYDGILLKEKASLIRAEASGQSWLQRNWRPIIMLGFGFIVLNNYAVAPYARVFGIELPTLELPAALLNLLTVGIGGYVVGRSAEKIFKDRNTSLIQGNLGVGSHQASTGKVGRTEYTDSLGNATGGDGDEEAAPESTNAHRSRGWKRRRRKRLIRARR